MNWMRSPIPVVLVGTVALVQPVAALPVSQVNQLARQFTVLIDGVYPGSGVIVARRGNTYTVLTAQHVVATEDEYTIVTVDGRRYPINYRSIKKLAGVDLALISFDSDRTYSIATLAAYAYTAQARNVFVSGWLKNQQTGALTHQFTAGQLANQRTVLSQTQGVSRDGYELFYSNLTGIGMSGGAVIDTDGRVIGIHGRSQAEEINNARSGEVERVNWGLSSGIPIATFLQRLPNPNLMLNLQNTAPVVQQTEDLRPFLTVPDLPNGASATDWVNRGNQLYRAGRLAEALEALDQAVQLKPNFYLAWYERGTVLVALRRLPEALTSFDETIRLKPDFYNVWRDRGVLLADLNQFQASLDSLDRATQIKPDDHVLWYVRGNLLSRNLRNYGDAIASYNRSLTIQPNFANAFTGRGRALIELHRYNEALADLNQAIQLQPTLTSAWILKARTLTSMGQRGEAIATLQRALQLQPNNPELRQMLTSIRP